MQEEFTNAPFTFGTIILKTDFVNRQKEIKSLRQCFLSGTNVILISPRRWGKSSLVEKVAESFQDDNTLKICKLDIFNVRTEEDFYISFTNAVLKATSSRWDDFVTNAKQFLSQLLPQVSLASNNETALQFGISWKELQKNPDDILNLAENIAQKKGIKIVVCFDEFQNIASFSDSLSFQKKLRSHFQRHQFVSYCFYGSKRHMLMEVFTDTSMPFYKFGDIIFLEKINTKEWVNFIKQRFEETNKQITDSQAKKIVELVDNHSYYVQQLAQQVWLRTTQKSNKKIIENTHQSLIQQLSLLFITLTETLTNTQLGFLKALLNGEQNLSSKEVINSYKLGSSANVVKLKRALVDKDILDDMAGVLTFQDPLYREWLKRYYFKIKH